MHMTTKTCRTIYNTFNPILKKTVLFACPCFMNKLLVKTMLNGAVSLICFVFYMSVHVCAWVWALFLSKVRVLNGVIFLYRSKEGNFSLWKKQEHKKRNDRGRAGQQSVVKSSNWSSLITNDSRTLQDIHCNTFKTWQSKHILAAAATNTHNTAAKRFISSFPANTPKST